MDYIVCVWLGGKCAVKVWDMEIACKVIYFIFSVE